MKIKPDNSWRDLRPPYFIGLGVVVGFVYGQHSYWGVDAEWFSPVAIAAWIEAIAVLAIFLGALISWKIHRNEVTERKADRRLQARGISLLIGFPLISLEGEIEREIESAQKKAFKQIDVAIPKQIMDHTDRIWIVGEAGRHVLQVVSALKENRRVVRETYIALMKNGTKEDVIRARDLAISRLEIVLEDVRDAIRKLEISDKDPE
jgi:hypothetical protein